MTTKRLEDMTLQELWALFPIEISPHRPEWERWAAEEIGILHDLLSAYAPVINHIGSTAVPSIMAKPIIDILVELPVDAPYDCIRQSMESQGYICMAVNPVRMSFNKGYTPVGYAERVFHIHIHRLGDNDEIRFRNYLTAHPRQANAYERLKQSLLPRYRNDRDAYTAAKAPFITRTLDKAP